MTPSAVYTRQEKTALLLILISILFRVIFFLNGGEFVARPLTFALQYLDPVLLREDLLRSLYYLHSQPPLFNLLLGVVLKVSPDPGLSYALLFTTLGLLIPLLLYDILTVLGTGYLAAGMVSIVFMLNPTLILYEHLLYYTHVETFLVLLAICCLAHWSTGRRTVALVLFWGALLCLALVRSLFHPVFFLGLALALAGYQYYCMPGQRQARRMLCAGLIIVLLPLSALCVKNRLEFGFFGTSSWDGMSLWNKVNGYSTEELEALHRDGIVSSRAVEADLEPFKPISGYPGLEAEAAARCHHAADCAPRKSTGKPNFNHIGYAILSRQLRQDARALIRRDPARFAFYTAGSYSLTLWYSSDSVHSLFEKNQQAVGPLEKLYRYLWFGFLGVQNRHTDTKIWLYTGFVTALYLLLYGAACFKLFRPADDRVRAVCLVCLFCLAVHAYTLLVSSVVEFGENNRFRFPVDAALLVLAAGTLRLWQRSAKPGTTRAGS
jgi:hypothetical protein